MGKVIEQKAEAERLGSIVNRLVRPDEGYVEFQLRQAMADAIDQVGREHALAIALNASRGKKANHTEIPWFYENVVMKYEGDRCLPWPYSDTNGYGLMTRDGTRGFVSRFICHDVFGPPPTDQHQAAHSCGNGHLGCCTKSHLRWATPAENQADRIDHGTDGRGERCATSKLTEKQVLEIRSLRGLEMQAVTAASYGVSVATISDIQRRNRWAWLPDNQEAAE